MAAVATRKTSRMVNNLLIKHFFIVAITLSVVSIELYAAVLPEDRSDVMYHRYDGGGVVIDGPSLLVRKEVANTVSISGNYYVDNVSSASIDVETSGASEYSEKRTEYSLSADYLYDKVILSAGYTNSEENDYSADTFYVSASQDLFGDLTTFSLGYSLGNDTVMKNGNDQFEDEIERHNYRFGLSQIATANLILTLDYEIITEEGYLNNPYRSYRFVDQSNPDSYASETEVYPLTRTSDAVAMGAKYFLPYRAAVHGNYRYFTDDWDIKAHNITLGYTHPYGDRWVLDLSYRFYQQESAYFYNDLHQYRSIDEKDFRARDKELSEFSSQSIGIGASYQLNINTLTSIERSSINFQYDFIKFDYDNFSDIRSGGVAGAEPLYDFDANVFRVYFSVWY